MKDYISFLEHVTAERIENCENLVAPEIRFRDPFNDLEGVEDYKRVLHQALEDMKDMQFVVSQSMQEGKVGFLRWTMTGKAKYLGNLLIEGMSEIHLNVNDQVILHVDYWDTGADIFARIPVLGGAIRVLQKRLGID